MTGREKDEWAMGSWKRYDVPVTYSILAPHESAATAFVRAELEKFPVKQGSPAYDDDHAFVDGHTHLCDCNGH